MKRVSNVTCSFDVFHEARIFSRTGSEREKKALIKDAKVCIRVIE
jgi:hypothetical protein